MSIFDDRSLRAHPWVIIGCGYPGERLLARLRAAGAQVWLTRRSAEEAGRLAASYQSHGMALDLDDPAGLARLAHLAHLAHLAGGLPANALYVVSAPPGQRSPDSERELVAALGAAQARRIVYISSTGVYPPGTGDWIDEDAPAGPDSEHGRARLAAESAVLAEAERLGIAAVSLRASGIYGPGRGVHARLLAGNYRIIGDGDSYVNRIHVDDLAATTLAAALVPELPRAVYNVADDEPLGSRAHADAVADILGVPRAPSVPVSEVSPRVLAMLGANRRIANHRIKQELGVRLAYPTWREGLRQILAEEGITPANPSALGSR